MAFDQCLIQWQNRRPGLVFSVGLPWRYLGCWSIRKRMLQHDSCWITFFLFYVTVCFNQNIKSCLNGKRAILQFTTTKTLEKLRFKTQKCLYPFLCGFVVITTISNWKLLAPRLKEQWTDQLLSCKELMHSVKTLHDFCPSTDGLSEGEGCRGLFSLKASGYLIRLQSEKGRILRHNLGLLSTAEDTKKNKNKQKQKQMQREVKPKKDKRNGTSTSFSIAVISLRESSTAGFQLFSWQHESTPYGLDTLSPAEVFTRLDGQSQRKLQCIAMKRLRINCHPGKKKKVPVNCRRDRSTPFRVKEKVFLLSDTQGEAEAFSLCFLPSTRDTSVRHPRQDRFPTDITSCFRHLPCQNKLVTYSSETFVAWKSWSNTGKYILCSRQIPQDEIITHVIERSVSTWHTTATRLCTASSFWPFFFSSLVSFWILSIK